MTDIANIRGIPWTTQSGACYIYALSSSSSPYDFRYIGKSTNPYERIREHHKTRSLQKKTWCSNWINKVLRDGHELLMFVMDIATDDNWAEMEKQYIVLYRSLGYRITNACDGGQGLCGHVPSEETRRKRSESMRGHVNSPEARRKISEKARGRKSTAEQRVTKSIAMRSSVASREASRRRRGKFLDEKTKRGMCGVNRGRVVSDETRNLISVATRGRRKKINQDIANTIRQEYAEGNVSQVMLAERYHVAASTIFAVLHYQIWKGTNEQLTECGAEMEACVRHSPVELP